MHNYQEQALHKQLPSIKMIRCLCDRLLSSARAVAIIIMGFLGSNYCLGNETGVIAGRVQNAASGEYMKNAKISLQSSTSEAVTNEIGEYRLSNVPVGVAIVSVSFTGMKLQTLEVTVAAEQTTRRDFFLQLAGAAEDSEALMLDKYTVLERELTGAAMAAQEKRMAPNIKDVISLEQVGDLGGAANIGEYLKYTPGISMGYDPQAPAAAMIRGMPPAGTIVTLDGAPLAASGEISTRGFDFTATASANIDRIEVSKTPTADMPANAVGGMINIVPKNPFARKSSLYSYNLYLTTTGDGYFDGINTSFSKVAGTDPKSSGAYVRPGISASGFIPVRDNLAFSFSLTQQTTISDWRFYNHTWTALRAYKRQTDLTIFRARMKSTSRPSRQIGR